MKKFFIFLGISCLIAGVSLFGNSLLMINKDGTFSVFDRYDNVKIYSELPLLYRYQHEEYFTRFDTFGNINDTQEILRSLGANELFREQVGDIVIIYAYSPLITKFERVHSHRVNVMIAVREERISVGSPLLKGSF